MIPSSLRSSNRRFAVRSFATVAVAVLIAAGCGGSDTDAAASDGIESVTTTQAPTETTAAEDTVADDTAETTTSGEAEPTTTVVVDDDVELDGSGSAADAPLIEIIDQGAEPRVELRYEIPDGVYAGRMSQIQSLSQSIDGQLASEVADLETVMEIEIATRAVDSGFELTTTYLDIGMGEGTDPATAAAAQTQLDELIGASLVATIDSRGVFLDQQFVPSPDSAAGSESEAVLESIAGQNQFANVLPEEAMGVGGSWRQTQNLTLNGIDVTQVTVYTVTAINGSVISLAVEGDQLVEPGPIAFPGLPDGVEVSVDTWDVGTTGTVELDLARPLPTSESTVNGTQSLAGSGVEEFTLVQDLTNVATVTPLG